MGLPATRAIPLALLRRRKIMPDSTTGARTRSDLFQPVSFGPYLLANRIAMAPLTRSRAGADGAPRLLMAQYYAQRA